jgi:hypothetical protein
MGNSVSYARVLEVEIEEELVSTIVSTGNPPELLEPTDVTANGQWWDLRYHDWTLVQWETEIIGPHGWVPVVTTARPESTPTTTYDYSVELIDGVPTEVWTERPWTQEELDSQEAAANTTELISESDEAVDKLVLVVEALNALTALTNATINQNPAAIIKDLARECKTIARQANREARLTSGSTESTFTGTESP